MNALRHIGRAARTCVFYVGYLTLGFWFGSTSVLLAPWQWVAPERHRRYVLLFLKLSAAWLRWVCGIRHCVRGMENIPSTPCVLLCQHQSTWETTVVPTLVDAPPVCIVLKQELLYIPFFGWGLAMIQPIAIQRGRPRSALKKLLLQGVRELRCGRSVLVFPEGTRQAPNTLGSLSSGGAALAIAGKVPVIPIAHNAGSHWPARQLQKYPGTIQIAIGPPIDSQAFSAREITAQCRDWMQQHMARRTDAET